MPHRPKVDLSSASSKKYRAHLSIQPQSVLAGAHPNQKVPTRSSYQSYSPVQFLFQPNQTVAHFTLRTFAFGMITSPGTVAAINLVGVEPSTERYLSQIDDAIIEGAYLEGLNPRDIVKHNTQRQVSLCPIRSCRSLFAIHG